MSRGLSANNQAEINAAHAEPVVLVAFAFDTPVYLHSGVVGEITYDSATYTAFGDLGNMSAIRESDLLAPSGLEFQVAATESQYITEALDEGNFRDAINVYVGYRQDDGTLVADPWRAWIGHYDHGQVVIDENESKLTFTAHHDLADLSEKAGDRYSDEDQQDKYSGDTGFEFVVDQSTINLKWGSGRIVGSPGRPGRPNIYTRQR